MERRERELRMCLTVSSADELVVFTCTFTLCGGTGDGREVGVAVGVFLFDASALVFTL